MIDFRKYLPYLLYSCKRVSAIISINPLERTSKERYILGYHKSICKACHNYQYQNTIIEATLSKSLKIDTSLKLSNEKKAVIIEFINKEAV
jgi:hypothetical protein